MCGLVLLRHAQGFNWSGLQEQTAAGVQESTFAETNPACLPNIGVRRQFVGQVSVQHVDRPPIGRARRNTRVLVGLQHGLQSLQPAPRATTFQTLEGAVRRRRLCCFSRSREWGLALGPAEPQRQARPGMALCGTARLCSQPAVIARLNRKSKATPGQFGRAAVGFLPVRLGRRSSTLDLSPRRIRYWIQFQYATSHRQATALHRRVPG